MPVYRIKAYDGAGKYVADKFSAESRQELLRMMNQQKLYPVAIKKLPDWQQLNLVFHKPGNKVSIEAVSIFLKQFYTLLHAGVSIPECIRIIGAQADNDTMKRILSRIHEKIDTGNSLSQALSEFPEVFPNLLLAMIKTGEASGYLEDVLLKMSNYYETESKIQSKVKGATVYPKFLALLSVALVVFMLIFIMPTFVNMFEDSQVPIPVLTQFVMSISNFLYRNFILLIFLGVMLWLGWRYGRQLEDVKIIINKTKLKIPIIKDAVLIGMSASFSSALSMLLKSGISMIQALEITRGVMGNTMGDRAVKRILNRVIQGFTLAQAVGHEDLFPPMLVSTIGIGEGAGSLDEVLEQLAGHFSLVRERNLEKMLKLLEPLMILVMAVVIGFLVIAMIMPMFDMISNIG